jgi:predicted CopG family antitoxin
MKRTFENSVSTFAARYIQHKKKKNSDVPSLPATSHKKKQKKTKNSVATFAARDIQHKHQYFSAFNVPKKRVTKSHIRVRPPHQPGQVSHCKGLRRRIFSVHHANIWAQRREGVVGYLVYFFFVFMFIIVVVIYYYYHLLLLLSFIIIMIIIMMMRRRGLPWV